MMRFLVLWALAIIPLFGCASMNRPRVYAYPVQGQHAGQQADDYVACDRWARGQTGYDATGHAVAGAVGGSVAGAAVGAVIGAIICAPIHASGSCAALGAAAGGARGGIEGGTRNLVQGREEFSRAYGVCMAARGYATAGAYTTVAPASAPQPPPPPPPPPPPSSYQPAPASIELPVATPPRRIGAAPRWCRGDNQEWLGTACLTRSKGAE